MTVADYIKDKFQTFGITVSEADLYDICKPINIIYDIEDMEDLDTTDYNRLMIAIVQFIPSLLLRANSKSVSENGHSKSQSWDISGIKEYYAFLCKKYGLDDELNADKPKVKFL